MPKVTPDQSVIVAALMAAEEAQKAMQHLVVQLAVLVNSREIAPKDGDLAHLLWRWACVEKQQVESIKAEIAVLLQNSPL